MGTSTANSPTQAGTQFKYPGIPSTGDGTAAVVHVEINATEIAAAYPITPSTQMGMGYQAAHANGHKNAWGQPIGWLELESEHSSATSCEGITLAGGRVTNFTSGQGLILMKEVLYTTSGKRLPTVLNIGSRALTSHALNVHCGHDDVMGVEDCGWGILFGKNVQEAADLCLIARRSAEDSETPFMNVQDGFLTSHTIENVLLPEVELIKEYLGNPRDKIKNSFDPTKPLMSGGVQNQDAYMSGKIAQRMFYDQVPGKLQAAMDEFYNLTGRRYGLVEAVDTADADYVIVAMGSTAETAMASIDYIRSLGLKVGVLNITSFRPFPGAAVAEALKNAKAVAVVERCDVPLGVSNPLTRDVEASLAKAAMGTPGYPKLSSIPVVFSGSAGLGSRDVTPGHMVAIVKNMAAGDEGKRYFSVGIDHPSALSVETEPDVRPAGAFSIRGHSVGGYGSVTTNKIIATMLGDIFGFPVQAAPKYGSEKKGLPTNTYLTTVKEGKIKTHSELQQVDFVPLMDPTTWFMGNPLVGLQDGGIVFQHTDAATPQELWNSIPAWAKYVMNEKKIRFYGIDTIAIARKACQSDDSLIQRFQGVVLLGVFLRITPFQKDAGLTDDQLFEKVRGPIRYYFGKRGENVVDDNMNAIKDGFYNVFEVTRDIMEAESAEVLEQGRIEWDAKGKDVNAFFI